MMRPAFVAALAAVVLALATSSAAHACVCMALPIDERLDESDAAVVGRVVAERIGEVRGAPQRFLKVEVDQRVKGDVERTLVVRGPSGTDCDITVRRNRQTGLLLTKAPDGAWVGTTCSLVDAGELVAAGGEPRGGPIKVVVGLVVLALVLLWSFARLRRGSRPQLPRSPSI
jgi:hypothetical protein